MNYLDLIILLPLIWGGFTGFRKGFIMAVTSLLALMAGTYGAIEFSSVASDYLKVQFDWSARLIHIAGFVIAFLIIAFSIYFIGRLIQKLAKLAVLGLANRLAGLVFGVMKYLFLLALTIYVVERFDERYEVIHGTSREESVLYDPISEIVPAIYPHVERMFELRVQE